MKMKYNIGDVLYREVPGNPNHCVEIVGYIPCGDLWAVRQYWANDSAHKQPPVLTTTEKLAELKKLETCEKCHHII